jgi:hypothetical protein
MAEDELLDLRFCDLRVRIRGTPLEGRIKRLYGELEVRGLRFRPHIWISQEWFTPDGVPGFAIPFYLTHASLMKLERRQMLQVEGATENECMRILRHETGHALDNAFRIHTRRQWKELFGSFRQPYPTWYQPEPSSRDYVLNLNAWYAQAHPAEDFAETFAVWLKPGWWWRREYQGWRALAKLEYVDRLMTGFIGKKPPNNHRRVVEPLNELDTTLREHYTRKRAFYTIDWPIEYDINLFRMFSADARWRSRPGAAVFLRRIRSELRIVVAQATGMHRYTVDHILQHMIDRCRQLKLHMALPEHQAKQMTLTVLTMLTMQVALIGYHRVPL